MTESMPRGLETIHLPQRQSQLFVNVFYSRLKNRDFPGGPVVKNLPCNAGDAILISYRGTKIPDATEQLSPSTTATEPCAATESPRTAAEEPVCPRCQRSRYIQKEQTFLTQTFGLIMLQENSTNI